MNEFEFENRLRTLFSGLKREEPRGDVLANILEGARGGAGSQFVPAPLVRVSFALLVLLVAVNLAVMISSSRTGNGNSEHLYEIELLDGGRY